MWMQRLFRWGYTNEEGDCNVADWLNELSKTYIIKQVIPGHFATQHGTIYLVEVERHGYGGMLDPNWVVRVEARSGDPTVS